MCRLYVFYTPLLTLVLISVIILFEQIFGLNMFNKLSVEVPSSFN